MKSKILDTVVDFRIESPTFGKYICVELSYENKQQLFLPRCFLHILSKADRLLSDFKDVSSPFHYNNKLY